MRHIKWHFFAKTFALTRFTKSPQTSQRRWIIMRYSTREIISNNKFRLTRTTTRTARSARTRRANCRMCNICRWRMSIPSLSGDAAILFFHYYRLDRRIILIITATITTCKPKCRCRYVFCRYHLSRHIEMRWWSQYHIAFRFRFSFRFL